MNFIKVFISSGVSFCIGILAALLIETFGGAVGSVIGTVPSTVIPPIFIILTELSKTPILRVNSALACIFGLFASNLLFLPCWKYISKHLPKKWSNCNRILITVFVSLIVWFIAAIAIISLQSVFERMGITMIQYSVSLFFITCIIAILLCCRLPPTPSGKNKVKWHVHIVRGFAASIATFISGILSQTDLGIAAGAMTTFPSTFLTTLVSVSLSQGNEVSTGAIGPLLISGLAVGWFAISTSFFFYTLHWHAAWCCLIGFIIAVCVWSIPVFFYIRWRRDVTTQKTNRVIEKIVDENNTIEMKTMDETKPDDESEQIPSVVALHKQIEVEREQVPTVVAIAK